MPRSSVDSATGMPDEFYVAVKEFDLCWDEIRVLSRNSLIHAFVAPETRQKLLDNFDSKMAQYESLMTRAGIAKLAPMPETRGFICRRYKLCN